MIIDETVGKAKDAFNSDYLETLIEKMSDMGIFESLPDSNQLSLF